MRIALIYPPPWKIPRPGDAPFPAGEGAPAGADAFKLLNNDFLQAPYGMLSIAAQAISAGHPVQTLNLSNACWRKVCQCIDRLDADIFGLSCVTANRRGCAMTAEAIRRRWPRAHIVAGGPHATALPLETLANWKAVDTVVVGEGEAAFMALVSRLASGRPVEGVAGTAWREGETGRLASVRPLVEDLDALVPPHRYFNIHKVVTSRGCPGNCTFCSSRMIWGRRVRCHSVGYVLGVLEAAVRRHGQRIITFRDDTFTADKDRVTAICAGIRRRGLRFHWSCETRADCVDDAVLDAMRRAGCRRISIGVESASPRILKTLRKRIVPETVLAATRLAKRCGLQVRYYFMAGNRGETWHTFQESLDFIRRARPHQFAFSQLHLYPGTAEYEIFRRHGAVAPETYFTGDFMHLTCFAGDPADAGRILSTLRQMEGVQDYCRYSAAACRGILARFPELPSAHLDLAAAYLAENCVDLAVPHLQRAAPAHPLPGQVYNAWACAAAARGRPALAETYLEKALACYPHQVVIDNLRRLAELPVTEDGARSSPVRLSASAAFETTFMRHAPESPDPDPLLDFSTEELSAW